MIGNQFKKLRPSAFRSHMRNQFVVDGRRIYKQAEFIAGVEFYAVRLDPPVKNQSIKSWNRMPI